MENREEVTSVEKVKWVDTWPKLVSLILLDEYIIRIEVLLKAIFQCGNRNMVGFCDYFS